MSTLIGRTLGQYQVIEQIGQGGMATVFKAYQPSLDRHVALKVLLHFQTQQHSFVERFEREAKTIASLTHPHILPVYDFGQEDGYGFLAMRYVEDANTLKEVMADSLKLLQVADLISQIAQALDAAHQKGIIHRDVKPANVLMDGDWVLLADFGLAKIMEDAVQLTGTGVGVGTPAYMSPEQGQGVAVDYRTDIYALGIILFEMLTGQIPNDAETPFGIVIKRLTEPLPFPRSINPDIPETVEQVILQALAREPEDRFDSAGEMAAALKEATALSSPSIVRSGKTSSRPKAGPPPPPAASQKKTGFANQDQKNRNILMQRVREFWIKGVLENSLHGTVLIELGIETRPEAVERPWNMVLQSPDLPQIPIPAGTSIIDIFYEMQQSLLILGEPGSGKTTILLQLARDLINRAEKDETLPIPAVFNLSSWGEAQLPLKDWLTAELNTRYMIPKRIALDWVENDELLLLLDGLDEVPPQKLGACVDALNAFHNEHLVPIVVSSRSADYEMLNTRLKLQGAITLQSLTQQQIETYLDTTGTKLSALRKAYKQDSSLQELAQSPLMLNVMTLAYQGASEESLSGTANASDRQKHLFETYIQQMFSRRGGNEHYPSERTKNWLTHLASGMQAHNQSIFLIEKLQRSWLPARTWRVAYMLIQRLAVMLLTVGVPLSAFLIWPPSVSGPGMITWLLETKSWGMIYLSISILFVAISIIGWLAGGVSMVDKESKLDDIEPIETLGWSLRKALKSMKRLPWKNREDKIMLSMFAILTIVYIFTMGWKIALIMGLMLYLLFWLVAKPIREGLVHGTIESKSKPNQGIHLSAKNALLSGIFAGPILAILMTVITIVLMVVPLWLEFGEYFTFSVVSLFSDTPPWEASDNPMALALAQALRNVMNRIQIKTLRGWIITIFATPGFLTMILLGGYVTIKHYILRFLLWRSNHLPWDLARFLNYATERVFLRKVGGGYIFVHRSLLEHFAELSSSDKTQSG